MNVFASLVKMLDPAHPCFTPETAANILRLPADPGVQRRVDELSAKANEGRLTREEESKFGARFTPES